jgi:ABC-type antimicrobial peptide transport system permease subunit
LVIFQFTVSFTLLAGTWVVYRQIQYAKDRPLGFDDRQLITTGFYGAIYRSFDAFCQELLTSGAVDHVAQSTSPPASVWRTNSRFNWKGKDPGFSVDFPNNAVSFDYGKTIGWRVLKGRDFSREFLSDSNAMIITSKTAQMMDLADPIGEIITWNDRPYTLIGIVENIMVGSPYSSDIACVYHIADEQENVINIRLAEGIPILEALSRIQTIYNKYAPEVPFEYSFVDQDVAKKFLGEERIGKLSSWFTALAICISILGLLGLSAFTAEKRTREIGIRKVLGASVLSICRLMTREFLILTMISFLIAIPLSYALMRQWLQNFEYRAGIPADLYLIAGVLVLLLTISIVSIQSLKAAWMNPVTSLKSE